MRLAFSCGRVWALTYVGVLMALLGGIVLGALAWGLTYFAVLDRGFFIGGGFAVYIVAGAVVVTKVGAYHPHPRFGAANAVTLLRLVLISLCAGLATQTAVVDMPLGTDTAWLFFAIASLAMLLDGADGWLARHQNLASRFGARFDMEMDALLILVLAILAAALGKAGSWVLLTGLLRYLYVAAGWCWPTLTQPLKPSRRRKIIAVIQGGVLALLLAPIVTPPASALMAGFALLLLLYSFGQDVVWVVRGSRAV
jgi:phosphatidylglycerophosphate synthase